MKFVSLFGPSSLKGERWAADEPLLGWKYRLWAKSNNIMSYEHNWGNVAALTLAQFPTQHHFLCTHNTCQDIKFAAESWCACWRHSYDTVRPGTVCHLMQTRQFIYFSHPMTQSMIDCMVIVLFLLRLEITKNKPTHHCATTALCPFTAQTEGLQYGCRMTQKWQHNLQVTTAALCRQTARQQQHSIIKRHNHPLYADTAVRTLTATFFIFIIQLCREPFVFIPGSTPLTRLLSQPSLMTSFGDLKMCFNSGSSTVCCLWNTNH